MQEAVDRNALEAEIKKLSTRVIMLRALEVIIAINGLFVLPSLYTGGVDEWKANLSVTLVLVFLFGAEYLLRRFKTRMMKLKELRQAFEPASGQDQ